jgi:hypothetical protein
LLLVGTGAQVEAGQHACKFLWLEADGSLVVEMNGTQRSLQIFGVVVPQPPPPLYMDIVGRRIHARHRPLRCEVRAVASDGRARARIDYFAWQDKSGQVWEDLALTLLDQGVVRVSDETYPERDEYLRQQRPAPGVVR